MHKKKEPNKKLETPSNNRYIGFGVIYEQQNFQEILALRKRVIINLRENIKD